VTLVQALATGLAVGWGLRAGLWMTDAITGAVLAAVANLRRRDSMRVNGQAVCSKCMVPCDMADAYHRHVMGQPSVPRPEDP